MLSRKPQPLHFELERTLLMKQEVHKRPAVQHVGDDRRKSNALHAHPEHDHKQETDSDLNGPGTQQNHQRPLGVAFAPQDR